MTTIINASTSSGLVVSPDNSGAIALQSNGTTAALANLYGIGLASAVPSSGVGIAFPSTQVASSDPNTLDDYEEGTWTPTCYHEGSNNSTWAYKVGYYVKIGGILHCWWTNDSGNSGTAGSALKVSGLPFTASSANLPYGTGGVWGSNGATLTGNHFINAGSTLVQLYRGGNDYTTQQSFVSGYFTFRVA